MKEFMSKEINIKKIYLIIILFLITVIDFVLLLNVGKKYSVTFIDDGKIYSYVVNSGNQIKELKIEESNFLGWYNNGEKFDFNTRVFENTILKAKYEEITSYKVSFVTNGGTKINDMFVKQGDLVPPPNDPEKENYIFLTWNLDNEEFDFDTKITKNITLTASWEEVEESEKIYTVSFDTLGGSKVEEIKVKSGAYIDKPINPVKEGYKFLGWYLNGKAFSWNFPIKSSFTLNAKWQKKETVKVTFNSNGGNYMESLTVYKNETTILPIPERAGYVFDGWYYRGKKYTETTKITKSLKLTAKWFTADQAALIAASKNIDSSYEITKGGTKINVTSEGCIITNSNSSVLDNIKRGLTDTKITLYFNIQCGTAKKTVKSLAIIKKSTYTYSIDNLTLQINGTNLDGEIFKTNGTKITNIISGKAKLSDEINENIILILKDDSQTSYVLKKI